MRRHCLSQPLGWPHTSYWISGRSPQYGLISTALQATAIVFGIYMLLDYWSVLR